MEVILKNLLEKTDADRVIFFEMKKDESSFGQTNLFKVSPVSVYSNKESSLAVSDKEILETEYPYHLFMHLLTRTFSQGEMHFSLKTPTSLKKADVKAIKKALKNLKITKFSDFAVTDSSFVSLHWVKDNSISDLNRNMIKEELEELKKTITKHAFW